ncbi:unnamed protein product, partial [Ectocarpus sp. 12 AP-2014]
SVVIISSIIGTILALLGFASYLFEFLEFLGILAPSISSIYFIHFFWIERQQYNLEDIIKWEPAALISWVLSSLISMLTYFEVFQITGAYFLDSFLLGTIIYLAFKWRAIFKTAD